MKQEEYYIRWYVKSRDNELFRTDITAWHLFEYCCLSAYPKGEFTIGRYQLSNATGIKESTAYQALKRLQKRNMISVFSNNRFSRISICKWRHFQALGNNQVTTNEQPSNNEVTHLDKELRIKNKEELNTIQAGVETPPAAGEVRVSFLERMNPDTKALWLAWEENFSEITTGLEENRSALNKLLSLEGSPEKVIRLIRLAARAWSEKYTPKEAKASSPQQLWQRRSPLLAWGKGKFKQHNIEEVR